MTTWSAVSLDEAAVIDLARRFAVLVERLALLCCEGALGAGKSTFARGWIRTVREGEEVPSPTFSLVQEYPYRAHSLVLYHFVDLEVPVAQLELLPENTGRRHVLFESFDPWWQDCAMRVGMIRDDSG